MGILDDAQKLPYVADQRTLRTPVDFARRSCGCYPAAPRWFVVQTIPGQAFFVETALSRDGWRMFHPLHLHRVAGRQPRIVPLFSNYQFVELDLASDPWPRICRQHGVQALLHTSGQPAPVPHGVVEALQQRTSARRVVDDPLEAGCRPDIPPGALVDVLDGPLVGLRGIVKLSGQDRCRVLLQLLGRDLVTEIPTRDLEPVF